jgi:hypothetical protein
MDAVLIPHTTVVEKYSSFSWDRFVEWVEDNFVKVGGGYYSVVYSNDDINYVVKLTKYSDHHKVPHNRHKIYKVFVKPLWYESGSKLLIQPKVKIPKDYDTRARISEKFSAMTNRRFDINSGNVGIMGRKHGIFDY